MLVIYLNAKEQLKDGRKATEREREMKDYEHTNLTSWGHTRSMRGNVSRRKE